MKEMIKKYVASVVCALATLLITGSVWAADPIAMWNSDFNLANKSGVTMTLNNNTINVDGTITMDQAATKGVFFKLDSGSYANSTVIFEVESMTIPAADGAAVVDTYNSASGYADLAGIRIKEDGDTWGIWNNNRWGTTPSQHRKNTAEELAASTRVALTYSTGSGTYAYMTINGTLTQIFGHSTLKGGSTPAMGWTLLGPNISTALSVMKGAKLKRVAFFNSVLSTTDITNYEFPEGASVGDSVTFGNTGFSGTNAGGGNWTLNGLTIQPTATVPAGTKVKIKNISFIHQSGKGIGESASTIVVGGITSNQVNGDGTSLPAWCNGLKVSYAFDETTGYPEAIVGGQLAATAPHSMRLIVRQVGSSAVPEDSYNSFTVANTSGTLYHPFAQIDAEIIAPPPKPVVFWNHDFNNTSKKGYTVSLGNNAALASDKGVTLTRQAGGTGGTGVAIDWDPTTFDGHTMTVLVKYSGVAQSGFGGHTALVATYWGEPEKAKEILLNANGNQVKLAYNVTSSSSGSNGNAWTYTLPASGLMRVQYTSEGIHYTFLEGSDGNWTSRIDVNKTDDTNLKKDAQFYGLKIGGTIAGTSSYFRPSMKVEAVAIFDETLPDKMLTTYEFPSYPATMMYSNTLASDDTTVTAGKYGDITVPDGGYKATAFTAKTKITGGEGSYSQIQYKVGGDNDTRTHTVSGWFKVSAYDRLVYTALAYTGGDHGGYKVYCNSSGNLEIGKCNGSNFNWNGNKVTAQTALQLDTWYYLTLAITKNDANRNAKVAVFVNGSVVYNGTDEFQTNLNGSNCIEFDIGADVSAAGLYIDTTAVTDAATIKKWATNEMLVEVAPIAPDVAKATLPQEGFEGTWSSIQWEGGITPSADVGAEITITGDDTVTIMQMDEADAITANGIAFKGTGGVKLWLSPALEYNGGKIVSEIPFALNCSVAVDVNSTSDLTYEYDGSREITPTVACTGVLTLGGVGGANLKAQTSVAPSHVTFANNATLTMNAAAATIDGIEGAGKFVKTGSAELKLNNKAGGYAIDGCTVEINGGSVKLNNGVNGTATHGNPADAKVKDATFIFGNGSNGSPLTQNGWYDFYGTTIFENGNDKTIFGGGNFRAYEGFKLVKRGAGKLTFATAYGSGGDHIKDITVAGGKIHFNNQNILDTSTLALDFSALDKTATPFDGDFTVATTTSFKFPSTLAENEAFTLCTGALNATSGVQMVTVGEKTAKAKLTFEDKTVKYAWSSSASATVSEDTDWSNIQWSPAVTDTSAVELTLTVTDGVVITLDELVDCAGLTVNGNTTFVVADSLYEDGCWEKKVLNATPLTAGTISFGAIKEGFYGAFTQTADGIWLRAQNKEVISINIAGGKDGGAGEDSPAENLVTGTDYYGIAPTLGNSWNNINRRWQSGGNQTITIEAPNAYDGNEILERPTMSLSATGKNTWNCDSITNPFLRGYLDDGNGVTVMVHGVPYSEYDVIVYATSDNASIALAPVTINGTQYTFKDGETKPGSDVWGEGTYATPKLGKNALRVNGCTGDTLTINATRTGGRATLCAVQVVNKGEVLLKDEFEATITASTKFSEITTWNKTFKEGQLNEATITVGEGEGEVEIEFDKPNMVLAKFTIVSERPIKFKATAALPNVPQFIIDDCTGGITYAWPVSVLATTADGVTYAGGAGSADAAATINFAVANGSMTLRDSTFYIGASDSGVQSTVNMIDATVYANAGSAAGVGGLGVGQANFNLSGTTKLTTEKVILSQGGAGRTANLTLSDSAEIVVTGSTIADQNTSSIMFGHYAGPSTFTLNGNAKFTAENAQVLVGKTAGDQTININGGVFTAKGIKASAGASGTNALNLNGGELKLGEAGISSYGSTTIPVTVDGAAKITSTVAMPITQTITVNSEKTLTLDATDGDITISAAVVNNGTINVVGGNVIFMPGTFNGTITTEGTGNVIYGYTVTINDCGEFTVPTGIPPEKVRLYRTDGTIIENTTIKDGKILYTPELYGKNAWLEYLFKGTLVSTGRDTGALQFDGTHCFPGNEYVLDSEGVAAGGIYAASAPWRNLTFPNEVTVVMYGKVMKTSNVCQIGIGSTTQGTKYTLFLASGDVTKEEVVLGYAYNNHNGNVDEHDILCRMTVPHAQTTEHLYAFTLKKVGDDTVVNIYLDGELLQPYTFKNQTVTLGSGIQLGSIHGGISDNQDWPADFGFKRSTDVETDATLDFVRVYDVELNNKVLRAIAKDYPYESPSGSFNRTLTGNENWIETDAWTKVGDTEMYDEPDAGSSVTITPPVETDVTLTSNLMDVETFEAMTFNAGGKITVVKGEDATGEIVVAGRTTISTDTQISIDAMELGGAVSVAANKTLTFDFSSLDLSKEFADRSIRLTGAALLGDGARIEATGITIVGARTATIVYDEGTQQYSLAITVDETVPFTYTDGSWSWGTQPNVGEDIVEANTGFAIEVASGTLEWPLDRASFTVNGGTLKATAAPTAACLITVNEDGTFDLGTIRGLTVAGDGSIQATITAAELEAGTATVFKRTEDATISEVTLVDEDGEELTGYTADYDEEGNYKAFFTVAITGAAVEHYYYGGVTYSSEDGTKKYVPFDENFVAKIPYGSENVIVAYVVEDGYTFSTGSAEYDIELGTVSGPREAKVPTDVTVGLAVAQFGTFPHVRLFTSLASAVAAAEAGTTIAMITSDENEAVISKSLTIDVGGTAAAKNSINVSITANEGTTINLARGGIVTGTIAVDGGTVKFQTANDNITGEFTGTLNYTSGTVTRNADYAVEAPEGYFWYGTNPLTLISSEFTWIGESGDDWNDPDNWQGGIVPVAGAKAIINLGDNAGDYTINLPEDTAALESLTLSGSATSFAFTGTGSLSATSYDISGLTATTLDLSKTTFNAAYTIPANSTLVVNGAVWTSEATFAATTSKFRYDGAYTAINGTFAGEKGTVEIGGTLNATGNITLGSTTVQYAFDGNITVNGVLTVGSSNGSVAYFNRGTINATTFRFGGAGSGTGAQEQYFLGDGASDNDTMVITANTVDFTTGSNSTGLRVYFRRGSTVKIGAGGMSKDGQNPFYRNWFFQGGKIVITDTCSMLLRELKEVINETELEVMDGKTLTLTIYPFENGMTRSGSIRKTGAGSILFASDPTVNFTVAAGSVTVDAGLESRITVVEGGTLKLKVTDAQWITGYTSTATIPENTNITFILPTGDEVTGEHNRLPPKAVDKTWVGGTGNWDVADNWNPSGVPSETDTVKIESTTDAITTITLPTEGVTAVAGATFVGAGDITLDGGAFNPGALAKLGAGTVAMTLGDDIAQAINIIEGTLALEIPTETTRTISGVISGAGALAKTGAGTLTLSGANTYAGGTTVEDGVITRGNGSAFGASMSTIDVKSGAALNWGDTGINAQSVYYRVKLAGDGVGDDNGAFYTSTDTSTLSSGNRHPISLELTDDASIGGTHNFGIMYHNGSGYNVATVTLNGHTLTKVGAGTFYTSKIEFSNGTVVVDNGTLNVINNSDNETFQPDAKLVVGENGKLNAFNYSFTVYDVEFKAAANEIKNESQGGKFVVKGTVVGSFSTAKLEFADTATIIAENGKSIAATVALTLPEELSVDLSDLTGSGETSIVVAPTGTNWSNCELVEVGESGWKLFVDGTTLKAKHVSLDGEITGAKGYNFNEISVDVNVTKIDPTLEGAKIQVVVTPVGGGESITATTDLDSGKTLYNVTVDGLAAGKDYDYAVTIIDAAGNVIEDAISKIGSEATYNSADAVAFSASAETGESVVKNGSWTENAPTIPSEADYYEITDDKTSIFTVTDDTALDQFVTMDFDLAFEAGFTTEIDPAETGAQAGVTVSAEGTEETVYWYVCDDGEFVKTTTAAAPGAYTVRMEFDYNEGKVRYSIITESETVVLTDAEGTTWFELGGESPETISTVSFTGASQLTKFDAAIHAIDTNLASVNGTKYATMADALKAAGGNAVTLLTNVKLDTKDITTGSYNIQPGDNKFRWIDDGRIIVYDDENGEFVIKAAEKPANGIDSFTSYVLQLDPEDEDSKPIGVAPADNGDTETLTVEIKGPDGEALNPREGYVIKYVAVPTAGEGRKVVSDEPEIDLPLPESGEVKYSIKVEVIEGK